MPFLTWLCKLDSSHTLLLWRHWQCKSYTTTCRQKMLTMNIILWPVLFTFLLYVFKTKWYLFFPLPFERQYCDLTRVVSCCNFHELKVELKRVWCGIQGWNPFYSWKYVNGILWRHSWEAKGLCTWSQTRIMRICNIKPVSWGT